MKVLYYGPATCPTMFCPRPSPRQRLALGLTLLVIVDIIWVGSSELTEYLFKDQNYQKPYFTTYLKTTMFAIYLLGFVFRENWRKQCRWPVVLQKIIPPESSANNLSEPVYIPIRGDDDGYSSIDSNDSELNSPVRKAVRFSEHMEVRTMSGDHADEAKMARLSYQEYQRKQLELSRLNRKFPVPTVCKLAITFCVLWFLANFSYQEALLNTQAGVVNILSSTSGLFTLILAAIWSSGPADKFTLSKFLAVLISLGGTVLICFSDAETLHQKIPIGTIWAVVGAIAYAVYLVALKRQVNDDEKLDIPMFFGFVGLFNLLVLWPGLLLLHYTHLETFSIPNTTELLLMLVNGLVGTVLSEILWLWGCFLTSSLIGTLALSLTTPLTMMFDIFIKKSSYNWMFYLGVGPVFLSFVAVTALSHYDNWDPALLLIRKFTKCMTRCVQAARFRNIEQQEQRDRLLPTGDHHA